MACREQGEQRVMKMGVKNHHWTEHLPLKEGARANCGEPVETPGSSSSGSSRLVIDHHTLFVLLALTIHL